MYENNTLGYWSALALCLTKVRSSRARCPATALIAQGGSNLHIVQDDEIGLRVYREWRDVINEEYDWELVCQ